MSTQVHRQFFGSNCIDLEALLAAFHKVLNQFPVLSVIVICKQSDDGGVVREHLQIGGCVKHKICNLGTELGRAPVLQTTMSDSLSWGFA